ncbi:unnamed protein product [Phaeothamnion confervicola]
MTALGSAHFDHQPHRTWVEPAPPSMLTMSGRAYHRIFDPNATYHEQVDIRNHSRLYMYGGHREEAMKNQQLIPIYVASLSDHLYRDNSWIRSYRCVIHDVFANHPEVVPEAHIVFEPTSRATHGSIAGEAPKTEVAEVAALLFQNTDTARRSIYIYPQNFPTSEPSDRPRFLPIESSSYEPLQYPLLFYHGEIGWGKRVGQREDNNTPAYHESLPIGFYARQRLMNDESFYLLPRVAQEWACDMQSRQEDMVLGYLRSQKMQQRIASYRTIRTFDAANDNDGDGPMKIGKRLPFSHPGHPAARRKNEQEALAVVARRGKPHLFITITFNPDCPEMNENLSRGQTYSDNPTLCDRIFKTKLDELLRDLRSGDVFGPVDYEMKVIEFQKRGLPHAHIVVKFVGDGPEATHQIDDFIWAQIPSRQHGSLRDTVLKHMVHRNCDMNTESSCRQRRKGTNTISCKDRFPFDFNDVTKIDDVTGRCLYRRPNNGETHTARQKVNGRFRDVEIDNRWIVPYNPYLLMKYDCHINVDLISADAVVKYLYKYVNKGVDFAAACVACDGDEIEAYLTARYISASEAV